MKRPKQRARDSLTRALATALLTCCETGVAEGKVNKALRRVKRAGRRRNRCSQ